MRWLLLLRCLRDTGMPIAEMLRFVQLTRDGEATLPERLALLDAHDRRVEQQIAALRNDQEQLRGKARYYRSLLPGPDGAPGQRAQLP